MKFEMVAAYRLNSISYEVLCMFLCEMFDSSLMDS